jgi:L-lactate dehydrogenase (cytochrome)/(S)-mandelate dehydrogenase
MKAPSAVNIAELRALARRRLPRILFDWVDGGAEDERLLRRNEDQFARFRLIPRCLTDIERIDLSTPLFERTWHLPFGIAPTGYAGLLRPGADLMLARAARSAGIPFVLSGTSTSSVEKAVAAAPGHVWFQLYAGRTSDISLDLLRRAEDAGVRTLVYTVDTPCEPKRERDIRNGFDLPLEITPRLLADISRHPKWLAGYLRSGGLPVMESWAPYARPGAGALEVAGAMKANFYSTQTWRDFERLRSRWSGHFVIKGILDPGDAETACRLGADAIIVSNHGGRQLDTAPTCLEALPHIRVVVPSRIKVFVDGGFRRGSDVVIALCLGADFVFTGRATLYGAIAGAEPGAHRAIEILRDEIERTMGHIGCCSIAELDHSRIMRAGGASGVSPMAPFRPADAPVEQRMFLDAVK